MLKAQDIPSLSLSPAQSPIPVSDAVFLFPPGTSPPPTRGGGDLLEKR